MSDPVKNVDIEDVLSSIRRLIIDVDKPRARDSGPMAEASGSAAVAPESDGMSSERLVLTPAFRVAEEAEVPQSTHDSVADDVSDVAESNDANGDDVGVAADLPPELLWTVPKSDVKNSDGAGSDQVDDGPAETVVTPDRSALEATIAELEASVGADGDFEPDHGSEEIDAVVWPRRVARVQAEATDAEELQDDTADDSSVAEVAFQHHVDDAEEIADSDSEETDLAPERDATEDRAADTTDRDDEALNAYLDDEGMMDEDMLRDLVTDIVRQELQGTMGERITRNVRKLVRREIHRILSSQDFE
ncbi:MAG: hypothetical protein QNL92_13010 [Octadecabacter sp.]